MTLRSCHHEAEIKDLMEQGHWPGASPPELLAHARKCSACADLVLVTQAFRNARAASYGAVELPSPGILWWRAQLRRRNAAVERINKPILGAQIFAFSITLLIAVGFVISQAQHGLRWLSWLVSVSQSQTFHLATLWPLASAKADWNLMYLVPILVMLALVSGVVLYLASEKQ